MTGGPEVHTWLLPTYIAVTPDEPKYALDIAVLPKFIDISLYYYV